MIRVDITTTGWQEYSLIDSGDGRKLEKFGKFVLDRPDPQAMWQKTDKQKWVLADAHFTWAQQGEKWKINKNTPPSWTLGYKNLKLLLSFGRFKHIGVFPEHESQWQEIKKICEQTKGVRVLNLFGYTGVASIMAGTLGAKVTHIDASKQTIETVKENIKLSNLPDDTIRLVCEDALKYSKRLVERKEQFEIIIMDPPAFGRGPKGEIWKIEEKLTELVSLIPKLLSSKAQLVVLNSYTAGYSARSLGELFVDVFKKRAGEISYGDIGIKQKDSDRILPTGIYSKWKSK